MQRNSYLINATIQFENPVQPPQWGAPMFLTTVSVVTNGDGVQVYQPAYQQQPTTPGDITDDVLAALQVKFAVLGLTLGRIAEEA